MSQRGYFRVEEFVPPPMFERFGEDAWRFVDPRLVDCYNVVRRHVDSPIIINNYHTGGVRRWSGIRTPGSKYYSKFSAHSFGMAGDGIGDFNYADLRADIISGKCMLPYPVRLEMGIHWFHMDVANTGEHNMVLTFNP